MTYDNLRYSEPMEMTFTVDDATITKLIEAFEYVDVPDCPWFEVQDRQGNKARYYRGTVGHWIPVTERLPEDLDEVIVTWRNTAPAAYYRNVKGRPFAGSAVYYRGGWYWWSSVTTDVLAEYGRYDSEKIDPAIEIVAWMPLPEPYREAD